MGSVVGTNSLVPEPLGPMMLLGSTDSICCTSELEMAWVWGAEGGSGSFVWGTPSTAVLRVG